MSIKDWLPSVVHAARIERALEPGQSLFRLGDPTTGFYEIVRGKVRLVRVDQAGREAVLYVAAAGETIAEASLFSPAYHCDAVAITNAVVRLYPKAAVLAEFQRDPKAAEAFMAVLARQVMSLRTRVQQRDIRSARDRVRHYLAVNVGPDGRTVVLGGTVKDLAGEIGLTHEALYRTLADMTAEGEIERGKQKIILKH